MNEATAPLPTTSGRRVLIVEDEVLISMVLEDILDMLGHSVTGTAATFADAQRAVSTGGFDLAVLDVNLGSDPVFPIADALTAAGVDVIFATGSHPDSLPERFRSVAVLEKPYAFQAVETVLQRFV